MTKTRIVTRACGHDEIETNFISKEISAEKLCKDCWIKKTAEKNQAIATAHNLPELTGSSKQIAWATTIRETLRLYIEAAEAGKTTGGPGLEKCHPLMGKTDAKFWIDNREAILKLEKKIED